MKADPVGVEAAIADLTRVFVTRLRDGVPMTEAAVLAAVDKLCIDVMKASEAPRGA